MTTDSDKLEQQVHEIVCGCTDHKAKAPEGNFYDEMIPGLMSLIEATQRSARLDELKQLRGVMNGYSWGHFDVIAPINDRLAQLTDATGEGE